MSRRSMVIPVSAEDVAIRRAWRVGEAAWLLGLSYDVTLALVRDGQLGSRRAGRQHLIPVEEIDRYLAPARRSA